MCITIVGYPDIAVINFEIKLILTIKSFCYTIKESRQKFKYLENEKSLNEVK